MGKGLGYWTGYPFHVFLILANEFCERFSYYGMKAVLVFYLWKALDFSQEGSTAIYHTFVVFCYVTPILGAMIADGWLGKYKTILFVSMIYALGNILMAVSAIKINGEFTTWLCFVALLVIAFGTGGIKPCVSSFGGDQFKEGQTRQKDSFFSLFYLTINIGSMISTLLIPYLRGAIYCFDTNCYALCFGIPAILMIVSIVLFAGGTTWYTRIPPGDSILTKFFGCIKVALAKKCCCCCGKSSEGDEKKDHWLDYAAPEYEQSFIEDVKDVMRVTWLFIPLPVFWALFDQMGSKWAFQAQQMNGSFENITVYPDMIHFMNPLLVVFIVPFLEYLVYPCLDKIHIPNRPLQRMTLGMILAGTGFLVTGFLQLAINDNQPKALADSQTKFQIVNACPYDINATYRLLGEPDKLIPAGIIESLGINGEYIYEKSGEYEFTIDFGSHGTSSLIFTFEDKKAYQIFATYDQRITAHYQPTTMKTPKGESSARVFNGLSYTSRVRLTTTKGEESEPKDFDFTQPAHVSEPKKLIYADFDIDYTNERNETTPLDGVIQSRNGPIYILLLAENENNKVVLKQITEEGPWSVNIFLQTPQYVIMSFGECLFSVTGLGFAYTQAPPSMKSILTAIWLLTVCFGNIIIIIVQSAPSTISQATEFFFFSGLMYITTLIFAIMSVFYTYVTPRSMNDPEIKVTCPEPLGHDNLGSSPAEENEYVKIDNKQGDKMANGDYNATQF